MKSLGRTDSKGNRIERHRKTINNQQGRGRASVCRNVSEKEMSHNKLEVHFSLLNPQVHLQSYRVQGSRRVLQEVITFFLKQTHNCGRHQRVGERRRAPFRIWTLSTWLEASCAISRGPGCQMEESRTGWRGQRAGPSDSLVLLLHHVILSSKRQDLAWVGWG